jgi:diguanylate cyclase (GGDEF)-like protein/PAS domain S-box-containing protein
VGSSQDRLPSASDGAASETWHRRVTEALASISDAVSFFDADDRFTWVNAAAERLLSLPAAELVGRTVWEVFPDLRGTELEHVYRRVRETREMQEVELFSAPLDRWMGGRVHPGRGDDLVVFFRDVHERRALDEERAAESSLIRAVLNALPARTAILDADGTILTTNAAWADAVLAHGRPFAGAGANYLEACRAAAAVDQDARAVVDGLDAVFAGRIPYFSLDYALSAPDGRGVEPSWWHLQAFPVDDRPRVVVTHTDITDRVTAEQRAAWQARHDHLTSLPNRAALYEAIAAALAEDDSGRVTVLYMDVDGFKQVNDSLGHSSGDLLLRELASRLAHRTRPSDVVGRLGGDEFVVVAHDCDAEGGEALARRFHGVFDEPFELAGTRLPLTVSIGIAASVPGHGPEDLLRDADAAMYAAKVSGPNQHQVFTPALRTQLNDRWQIASRLRDAASIGEFVVHWQPVVDLRSGEVAGCEALLRWNHPLRGLVQPADFIPIAEENGLIVPITRWLLRNTVAQAAVWDRQGLQLAIAVNISAVHLASGTLVDDVLGAVADGGLPAGHLMIELTETSLARDPDQATAQFTALREQGVRVAIDDFGTGYSSLSTVASLPVDVLKIDRALVAGLGPIGAAAPAAILGAVSALGAALDMQVVAEGVETREQVELARRVGCAYAQGFHLSRPMAADQLTALLEEGRRRTGRQLLPEVPSA